MAIFRKLRLYIYAYFVKYFRTRHILRAFTSAHQQELRETPFEWLPVVLARQQQEVQAIKSGKLDQAVLAQQRAGIVDRKTWTWPYLPGSVQRLSIPVIKSTPYNLRRMSRTPVPRRAFNLIKGALISLPWEIGPIDGEQPLDNETDQQARIKIATECFRHPNNVDSFQTYMEQGVEDMCLLGGFVTEVGVTVDPERPIKMWPVDVQSVRVFASWRESTPDLPRYCQMTGLKGERGAIVFYDDEMVYIKDNPSTDSPFGLGKMEVAFTSVNSFLGVQEMSGRAGTDQIHKTFLWWEAPQNEAHIQIVRRHIQNELEGQAKLSLITGMKKPDPVEVTPVTEQDLLLNWQELLIRMIALGFDMSAMSFIERDINRATGEVMHDADFQSAVVPMAKRLMEAWTRHIIHRTLGWTDLEFSFLKLDDPDLVTQSEILARMFSMNAITPNEIRIAMGRKPIDRPFADLTQWEMMLINMEMMAEEQDKMQVRQMSRQLSVQQTMQDQQNQHEKDMFDRQQDADQQQREQEQQQQGPGGKPPQQGNTPGPGNSLKMTPGNVAREGQMPSPKPMSLPKFPIASSKYTAKDVAFMPINQVNDVFQASGMRASEFLLAMDTQEPGILQQMSDELKVFFQEQLAKEQQKKPLDKKRLAKWQKELAVKYRKWNKRTNDMAHYLDDLARRTAGKPGSGSAGVMPTSTGKNKAGKPGKLGPSPQI